MKSSSAIIQEAIDHFSALPGIGKKSALRLVLHVLQKDPQYAESFAKAIQTLRTEIKPCSICGNYTENEVCGICTDKARMQEVICVVESIRDLMAIEETGFYKGCYHVLGGLISPLEGVGPSDLRIDSLFQRVEKTEVKELIMAISPTIDGETTIFYISKNLKDSDLKISTIARGVSFGGELEYTDQLTLSRSIESRIPYSSDLKS